MKKVLSIFLAIIMALSVSVTGFAREYSADDFDGNEPEIFCKIKKVTVIVSSRPQKVDLYADYYAGEECELIWSIEGKSNFVKGVTKKTANDENVTLRFKGDTTVRLKLVSSDGRILAEDEMFLESYTGKDISFFDRLAAAFLGFWIIILGIFGGTFGPIIGKLL